MRSAVGGQQSAVSSQQSAVSSQQSASAVSSQGRGQGYRALSGDNKSHHASGGRQDYASQAKWTGMIRGRTAVIQIAAWACPARSPALARRPRRAPDSRVGLPRAVMLCRSRRASPSGYHSLAILGITRVHLELGNEERWWIPGRLETVSRLGWCVANLERGCARQTGAIVSGGPALLIPMLRLGLW